MAARGSPQEPAPPGRPHSGGRAGTGGQGALARGAHTSIRLTLQQILAGDLPRGHVGRPGGHWSGGRMRATSGPCAAEGLLSTVPNTVQGKGRIVPVHTEGPLMPGDAQEAQPVGKRLGCVRRI